MSCPALPPDCPRQCPCPAYAAQRPCPANASSVFAPLMPPVSLPRQCRPTPLLCCLHRVMVTEQAAPSGSGGAAAKAPEKRSYEVGTDDFFWEVRGQPGDIWACARRGRWVYGVVGGYLGPTHAPAARGRGGGERGGTVRAGCPRLPCGCFVVLARL